MIEMKSTVVVYQKLRYGNSPSKLPKPAALTSQSIQGKVKFNTLLLQHHIGVTPSK
jgi:hypothetical protein